MRTSTAAFESAGSVHVTSIDAHDAGSITIPDAHFLFHADFKRAGSDLTLTGQDGHRVVVPGYFKHEHLPTLLSPEGAALTGDLVEALAGSQAPDQYAQAGAATLPSGIPAIGRVATVQGTATALRNGVTVTLNVGEMVLKGDVIQTGSGSAVGVVFSDGTTFNLTADARMVLNDFVYSPGGSSNAALINLVQGSFTFIAGEVAHTGDLKVGTPVATMGIRGTAVSVTIQADNGATNISVMAQGDNLTHSVTVYALPTPADLAAGRFVGAVLGVVTNNGGVFSFTPTPTGLLVQETGKDAVTLQTELAFVQNAFATQSVGEAILQQQPLPNQNANNASPGTQIISAPPTDISTTSIVVTVATTPTDLHVTNVQVIPPPPGTPAVIPFIETVTPPTPVNNGPVAVDDTPAILVTYFDNFDDHHFDGWTPVSLGNFAMHWTMNGQTAAEQSDSGTGFLRAPSAIAPPAATAYTVDVDVNPRTNGAGDSHTNNGVGVVFGYVNAGNYYRAYWADYGTDYTNSDHRDLILSKVVNGHEIVLDRVNDIDLGSGEIHFQVVVGPDGITVNVNGSEHDAQLTSTADAPALNGVGLFTDNNDEGVAYDHFTVTVPALTTNEDTALIIPDAVLLANDTDPNDPHSALTIVGVTDLANGHGHAVLNGDNTITFTPDPNYNGEASFTYTVSDGHDGTATATVDLTINAVNDPPVIHTQPGGIHYWASNTIGDVTPINHISFSDVDAGSSPVWVTFTMNDFRDSLSAENLSGSGVTVVSGDGSSQIKLQGSISDINAYLFHGNLLWNPDGFGDHESGLLTVQIDDNGASPGGNVVSSTVLISEISNPNFFGSSTQDFSDVNFMQVGTVNAGNGNDTITTSWNHQGGTTTYDGGSGNDTINLLFTPDQLAEVLADPTMQADLRSYISDPSGNTLDLSDSSWNAEARNFEHANISLVTGFGAGTVSLVNTLVSSPDFIIGSSAGDNLAGTGSGNHVIVGLAGDDTLTGGPGNDGLMGGAGNDVLIGGPGNDVMSGSTGADTFVFTDTAGGHANFGKDIIVDFQPGEDSIEIDHSIFANFAALEAATTDDGHGNAVITADANNTITLSAISKATIIAHQSDFHLV